MAPALKLLLCGTLLLGLSCAQEPQRRTVPTATATPEPPYPPAEAIGLLRWNYWLPRGGDSLLGHGVDAANGFYRGPPRNGTYKGRTGTRVPPFYPTICPSKQQRQPDGKSAWEGLCKSGCMRQFMTPVIKYAYTYNSECRRVRHTPAVTYSEAPRWGDPEGSMIPQEKLLSLARLDPKLAYPPECCNSTETGKTGKHKKTKKCSKTKGSKVTTKMHTPARITAPVYVRSGHDSQHVDGHSFALHAKGLHEEDTYATSLPLNDHKRGIPAVEPYESDSIPPAASSTSPVTSPLKRNLFSTRSKNKNKKKAPPPDCTDYPTCFLHCQKVKKKEDIVTLVVLAILGVTSGALIAYIVGRKIYEKKQDRRRREISGESGNAIEEPQVEEVVEVVQVEPRPEEQTPKEKKDVDVPTVIVEEPTPTHPRSVDGASNDEILLEDRGRLRAARASGSDVHESSARLRHE